MSGSSRAGPAAASDPGGLVAFGNRGERRIRYNGFISYRRLVDTDLAEALRDAFQRIAKPWYKRRALRIFHDINSLAAGFDVGAAIHDALAASEFLILLASPESAESPYVQDEVKYWLDHKPLGNLLIALTGGELRWDPVTEDFDWEVTDCLPPALRGRLTKLPDYADLREARDLPESARTEEFQRLVRKLAAALHHLPPEDLDAKDLKEHRRTRRTALTVIAVLAALAVAASIFGVDAVSQARLGLRRRERRGQSLVRAVAVRQFLGPGHRARADLPAMPDMPDIPCQQTLS